MHFSYNEHFDLHMKETVSLLMLLYRAVVQTNSNHLESAHKRHSFWKSGYNRSYNSSHILFSIEFILFYQVMH